MTFGGLSGKNKNIPKSPKKSLTFSLKFTIMYIVKSKAIKKLAFFKIPFLKRAYPWLKDMKKEKDGRFALEPSF